ncbi:RNA polymerase sigma factor [Paraliomyxa miuraensis]|uniref:RNA polymerase sigma factor n=1 Tax=Paraliomyxa miuraensis TaxID=376150 RepID=UPI002254CBF1|nr:sigma-70 family RNA polymerase sigma factor [Paraliomyxa miuraensis]MCX4240166.1 sigma-70 family RNA polymerase sigma factor [Paraliomyxa miuraensis]
MCSEPRSTVPEHDAALLAQWRSGNTRAGLLLLRRQVAPTRRYFARRVPCRADVEDLVQRTLLASLEALPRFREDTPFSRFVRAIASKLLLRHRRDAARMRGRLDDTVEPDASPGSDSSAVEHVLREDTSDCLRRAFRRLPEASARILRLHYWEDRDATEIGRELGLNPGAVRTRLHRARHEMKRALGTISWPSPSTWLIEVK